MLEPVLTVTGLRKFFTVTRGFPRSRTVTVRALDRISFRVRDGEAFGLVGESGCGKSTAGRAVLRLVEPDAGEIVFKGENVITAGKEQMRALRRKLQIIFQDPYASLNPRRMIGKALIEPMRVHGMAERAACEERAKALLAEVGLPENAMMRYSSPTSRSPPSTSRSSRRSCCCCNDCRSAAGSPSSSSRTISASSAIFARAWR